MAWGRPLLARGAALGTRSAGPGGALKELSKPLLWAWPCIRVTCVVWGCPFGPPPAQATIPLLLTSVPTWWGHHPGWRCSAMGSGWVDPDSHSLGFLRRAVPALVDQESSVPGLAWEPGVAFHLRHQSPQPCHYSLGNNVSPRMPILWMGKLGPPRTQLTD